MYSSGQNKVNVPFAFCFRATVLVFKRNAKRTLTDARKTQLNASVSILWDGIYRFTVQSTRACRRCSHRACSSTSILLAVHVARTP